MELDQINTTFLVTNSSRIHVDPVKHVAMKKIHVFLGVFPTELLGV